MNIRKLIDQFLDLLYPRRCPQCDRILPKGQRICESCYQEIRFEHDPRCMKCGRSLKGGAYGTEQVLCADCEAHPHIYDHGYPLAEYHSVAHALFRMKYAGRRQNAEFFGDEIVRRLGRELLSLRADMLVPVPLHPARRRKRGYNQAADVARVISRRLNIPVREDLIERVKNTAPMKQSDERQKRRNNLKNAFQLKGNDVKCKRIIIVDDIYTSGSTIDAVAEEFRKAGASGIFFVTVAAGHLGTAMR